MPVGKRMRDGKIEFIDKVKIENQKILLRVDFNVSLTAVLTIADDLRIKQSLATINYLLENKNKLILISHLDRPRQREKKYSLKVVVRHLAKLLPDFKIKLIDDFLSSADEETIRNQQEKEILILENIRFYSGEKKNRPRFAKKLASLAKVYINDAFGVCHRADASVVGVPNFLPSYGGLLLKKEMEMIKKIIKNPKKPLVVIIGGAKIASKIAFINKVLELADYLLIGGKLANIFLCAQGFKVGTSQGDYEKVAAARKLLFLAAAKKTAIVIPADVVLSNGQVKKIAKVKGDERIFDIGPETQARFAAIIARARTIIWNGPVGYIENPAFRRGTDFIYYAITKNQQAVSLVGGGDTLAAIAKKEYLDKITHLSTGGGAMLEFIEKGTLPGIEALRQ